jgi:hypothetical protein
VRILVAGSAAAEIRLTRDTPLAVAVTGVIEHSPWSRSSQYLGTIRDWASFAVKVSVPASSTFVYGFQNLDESTTAFTPITSNVPFTPKFGAKFGAVSFAVSEYRNGYAAGASERMSLRIQRYAVSSVAVTGFTISQKDNPIATGFPGNVFYGRIFKLSLPSGARAPATAPLTVTLGNGADATKFTLKYQCGTATGPLVNGVAKVFTLANLRLGVIVTARETATGYSESHGFFIP